MHKKREYYSKGIDDFIIFSKNILPDMKVCTVTSPFGKDVWSRGTKNFIFGLVVHDGHLPKVLQQKYGVPHVTISKWTTKEETAEGRKKIIREWYGQFQPINGRTPDNHLVSLDDYLSTFQYIGKALPEITNDLFSLKEGAIMLPYSPTPTDAYLFGANHGNGSLNSNFTLQFTGTEEELDIINQAMPLHESYRGKNITLFSPTIGRLYYKLGLPKGNRQEQEMKLPTEWIKGEQYISEFLGGLFDTAQTNEYSFLKIVQKSKPEFKSSFKLFIENIADMFRELGIDITKGGAKVRDIHETINDEIRYSIAGVIPLKVSGDNIHKIQKRLATRFPRSKQYLDQRVAYYNNNH